MILSACERRMPAERSGGSSPTPTEHVDDIDAARPLLERSTVGVKPSLQATAMTTSLRPSPLPPTPRPIRPPPSRAGRESAASPRATTPGLPPLNGASGEAAVITAI
jgi:hypothetical protein